MRVQTHCGQSGMTSNEGKGGQGQCLQLTQHKYDIFVISFAYFASRLLSMHSSFRSKQKRNFQF
jgi:hypothetical protein